MYDEERDNRRLYVASHSDDTPNLSFGALIPKRTVAANPKVQVEAKTPWYLRPAFLLTFSIFLFALSLGSAGFSIFQGRMSAAAPIVVFESAPYKPEQLQYGVPVEFSGKDTYTQQKDSLISERVSFVDANLVDMQITFFEAGNPIVTMPVVRKSEDGSWWQVPSGLYSVDGKKQKRYSSFSNIYLPWSFSFDGNFYINGIPYYRDGVNVPEKYTGGGVQLSNEDAETLFNLVTIDTPVLVYERNFQRDDFLYEAKVDGIHAQHYLIADLKSSTVLAASDLDEQVPIASLTKLMTALVAAEETNLDTTVPIQYGLSEYVTTLVPRLEGGNSVSMYSLLQLLLSESSNEAAEVIASVVGRETFIAKMNEKANDLGLSHTVFTDPSGLDDGNESSVSDLLRLLQYIQHNRGFILELTASQHLKTAYTNGQFGQLANFNQVADTGFVAGKVGETNAAGKTSVSIHTVEVRGEMRSVAIVLLGTDERTNDIKRLIAYVDEQFKK